MIRRLPEAERPRPGSSEVLFANELRFAKPASMTSPNGDHRRQGDFTTDLRVLVIATTSVIVATAGVIAGVVLLNWAPFVAAAIMRAIDSRDAIA
jgi:hypothetical protein